MSFAKVYLLIFNFSTLFCLITATCPPNSTPGSKNGKCYSFMTTTGDFISAERSCTEVGGHLVSICDAFENNFLADVAVGKLQDFGAKDFWIGYNDLYNKGAWNWTSNASCSYANWGSGQPGTSDCASFQISGGKWQGSDCTTSKPFVCETYSISSTYSTPVVSVKPVCKSGYTFYDEWNTCYKYFTTGLSWSDAETSCVNDGGHLVSIHSKNEEIFIDGIMHQIADVSGAWIGISTTYLQNPSYEPAWTWTDRTPASYSDWLAGYPGNISTCAYMVSSGNHFNDKEASLDFVPTYWINDYPCNGPAAYICKQFPICS